MSELIQKNDNRATIRWKLLTGASALALAAYISSASVGNAEDADRPTIWIELGGQFDRQTGLGEMFVPPFVDNYADSQAFKPISPSKLERVPLYSEDLEGAISFQPQGADWKLSAGIRYGRSSRNRDIQQGQLITAMQPYTGIPSYSYTNGTWQLPVTGRHFTQQVYEFAGVQIHQSQKHMILDFSAGRDVGLGMFGKGSSSTVDIGVRFAQFISNSSSVLNAKPDALFADPPLVYLQHYFEHIFPSHDFKFYFPRTPDAHQFEASSRSQRKFNGIGPSLAWAASVPIVGDPDDEALTLDWGINAAVLFGRQQAKGHHQTHGSYYGRNHGFYPGIPSRQPTHYTHASDFSRSRRVTIPNLGGMVGMSLKFSDFKVSVGYRGDFFFGAMDQGIDTRKTGITGFYGPFASISFGLGD